jgi:hypothetical protein
MGGIGSGRKQVWSTDLLIAEIRRVAAELGRSPGPNECRPSANTYARYFGSFSAALREAGLERYRHRARDLTPSQRKAILNRYRPARPSNIRALAKEFGVSYTAIKQIVWRGKQVPDAA